MLEIDGAQKSGSGTILRDAVPFCVLTGQALRLRNIRYQRDPPGLRAQHLRALQAAADLSIGSLEGARVGSLEIAFHPGGRIRGGSYRWEIGTAGSTVMLAMTVLPLTLFADGPSRLTIEGGLFQDFAPSALHFEHVLVPLLRAMGAEVEVTILRPGYVPRGGGCIEVRVKPAGECLRPLSRPERGELSEIRGIALCSRLQERKVADRLARACNGRLRRAGLEAKIETLYDTPQRPAFRAPSPQPGAALAIWAVTEMDCRIGADMAGALNRSAEFIGERSAEMLLEDLNAGATVDRHLADQLIPFAALAGGITAFRIPAPNDHVEARMWLVERILGAKAHLEGNLLTIEGIGYRRG